MRQLPNSHPFLLIWRDADGIRGIALRFYDSRKPIPGEPVGRSDDNLGDMRNLCASLVIGFTQTTEILFLRIADRQRQIVFLDLA